MNKELIKEASGKLLEKNNIVVLTGSGISAESGIPTFRGENGLWLKYSPEKYGTVTGLIGEFLKSPKKVLEFALNLIEVFNNAMPNQGHLSLACLEKDYGKNVTIITQNIDDLHEVGGNSNVVKVHGDLYTLRCTKCNYRKKIDREYLKNYAAKLENAMEGSLLSLIKKGKELLPVCPKCGGIMRPDVVFFGEALPQKELAKTFITIDAADVMIIVGTSGEVYPANTFPYRAKENGALLIEVNPQRTIFSETADYFLEGNAGDILPELIPPIKENISE